MEDYSERREFEAGDGWGNYRRDFGRPKRRRMDFDGRVSFAGDGRRRPHGCTMPETMVDPDVAHAMKDIARVERKSIFQVCRDAYSCYLESRKEMDAMFKPDDEVPQVEV